MNKLLYSATASLDGFLAHLRIGERPIVGAAAVNDLLSGWRRRIQGPA